MRIINVGINEYTDDDEIDLLSDGEVKNPNSTM